MTELVSVFYSMEKPVINRMLRSRILFHFLTCLNAAIIATPLESNPTPATHQEHDSRAIRSLASLIVNNSLTGTTNLTLPTIAILDNNASSNAEPTVFCHMNPPFPYPQIWGHVDIVECGLLIMTMLADDSADLHASQWSPTYPLLLPWTWGIPQSCKIEIDAVNRGSSDVFQQAMIAQRAALIVSRCLGNKGGMVSLGPRGLFRVRVFASGTRGTA